MREWCSHGNHESEKCDLKTFRVSQKSNIHLFCHLIAHPPVVGVGHPDIVGHGMVDPGDGILEIGLPEDVQHRVDVHQAKVLEVLLNTLISIS